MLVDERLELVQWNRGVVRGRAVSDHARWRAEVTCVMLVDEQSRDIP